MADFSDARRLETVHQCRTVLSRHRLKTLLIGERSICVEANLTQRGGHAIDEGHDLCRVGKESVGKSLGKSS